MTINHEKKLIFIHIPKNAGTSDGQNIMEWWNKYSKIHKFGVNYD